MLSKGLKKIGQGSFSTVWRLDEKQVLIASRDDVKLAMSEGAIAKHKNFPVCTKIENHDDDIPNGYEYYKMPFYHKFTGINSLNKKDLITYRELKKLILIYNYNILYPYFKYSYMDWTRDSHKITNEIINVVKSQKYYDDVKEALIFSFRNINNYFPKLGIEAPKQNLALDLDRNLILLDIMFDAGKC